MNRLLTLGYIRAFKTRHCDLKFFSLTSTNDSVSSALIDCSGFFNAEGHGERRGVRGGSGTTFNFYLALMLDDQLNGGFVWNLLNYLSLWTRKN